MTRAVLQELSGAGVSIWLDDLDRERLNSGSLLQLIEHDHVRGVTTNPAIFQKAVSTGSASYRDDILRLAGSGLSVDAILRTLTTDDVRRACDLLLPVWEDTLGVDGRVSIEVDPRLAHDAQATVIQARELAAEVDRPNLLIKIPATPQGLPAISATLAAGISVNVTLIFSVERYREVMAAYLDGMERASVNGHDVRMLQSVASFFVSRVDTEVDARIDAIGTPEARALRGRAAIANARLAWFAHLDMLAGSRWAALAAQGAHPQRPLWASTGVKDPAYDDTRYVMELVAPGCVNTMPEPTLDAVRDHGVFVGDTVSGRDDQAREVLHSLALEGIDLSEVYQLLESDGVVKFVHAWNDLRATVAGVAGIPLTDA